MEAELSLIDLICMRNKHLLSLATEIWVLLVAGA